MLRSWKLGRAFGIPLYLHPSFLLLPAFIVLQKFGDTAEILFLIVGVCTAFVCVMLHELGHALMARYFNIPTRDITLYPIGGVARLERMTDRPVEELLIAVAGPAVNVVIALLLLPVVLVLPVATGLRSTDFAHVLVTPAGDLLSSPALLSLRFLGWLLLTNVVLVVFNMIPAFPMDGGRVFRALLAMMVGLRRATEVAAAVGLLMAGLLGVAAVFMHAWMLLAVVFFVALAGQAELRAVRYREALAAQAAAERAYAQTQAGYPYPPAYGPYQAQGNGPYYDPTYPALPPVPAPVPPRPVPRSRPDEDIETVVLRPGLSGQPARAEAPPPHRRPGFTGLVWDRDQEVWVRWENGQPVTTYG